MASRRRGRPNSPPTSSAARGGQGAFCGGTLHLLVDPAVAQDINVARGPGEDSEAATPVEEASGGHVTTTREWKTSPGSESPRPLWRSASR
jgi:hypothetical protein